MVVPRGQPLDELDWGGITLIKDANASTMRTRGEDLPHLVILVAEAGAEPPWPKLSMWKWRWLSITASGTLCNRMEG